MRNVKDEIFSEEFLISNRISPNKFIRKRKMPFISIVLFMLNLVKQTLQKELTNFMNLINFKKGKSITKSAFSQSRLNLKPRAFKKLNQTLVNTFYDDKSFKKWNDFRLMAVDGSTLQLPNSKDIISKFGVMTNNTDHIMPAARISTLFDLLNEIMVDTQIDKFKSSEYDLSVKHLDHVGKNDLIIYDRGYASIWLFFLLINKKVNFVVRLSKKFIKESNLFFKSKETSKIIEINFCSDVSKKRLKQLNLNFKTFKLRLVKVILEDGEVEVLATTLLDGEKYNTKIFKELYFLRWGVETNYRHLKSQIQIENFTGKSSISVEQDFYANCFITNVQILFINDAQEELIKEKKNNELKYKINKNLSLGYLKDRIIPILMLGNEGEKYDELKRLFKLEPVPIRNGRKFSRKVKRRRKYPMNAKKTI
ncbi:MAG: IS4 family transposase [Candidatus Woesearchaeota archaeon]